MLEHAIRAGEALIEAKRLVPRGQWEAWLVEQFPDRGITVPRDYMRVARHQAEVRELQPTNMNNALLLLRDRKHGTYDPEMRDEARRLLASGEFRSCRAVARHLGLNYHRVWRWCYPEKAEAQRLRQRAKSKAGRRALQRQEREAAVRRHGGPLAEAYVLIRRSLQELERASETETDREVRREIASAMQSIYNAEDRVTKAVRNA